MLKKIKKKIVHDSTQKMTVVEKKMICDSIQKMTIIKKIVHDCYQNDNTGYLKKKKKISDVCKYLSDCFGSCLIVFVCL